MQYDEIFKENILTTSEELKLLKTGWKLFDAFFNSLLNLFYLTYFYLSYSFQSIFILPNLT